ncbi:uncharacterized protein LOC111072115 isoform X2 [Drosophila obscura]|uniref:uncharacterized protein LOC111072115 isoform X2 n=1 Tax=Drosophila obscura TaxID=7282 RepID=UPI001BB15FA7|nr:uncharacterized protein LOC111072115 isoform X2 [Drosophila obscura]
MKKFQDQQAQNTLEDYTEERTQKKQRERDTAGDRYNIKHISIRQNSRAEIRTRQVKNWAVEAVDPPTNFRGFAPPPPPPLSQHDCPRRQDGKDRNALNMARNMMLKRTLRSVCDQRSARKLREHFRKARPKHLVHERALRVDLPPYQTKEYCFDTKMINSLQDLPNRYSEERFQPTQNAFDRKHKATREVSRQKQPKRKTWPRLADLPNNHMEPYCEGAIPDGPHLQHNPLWDIYYRRIPHRDRIRVNELPEEQNLYEWMEPARRHCFVSTNDIVSEASAQEKQRHTGGGSFHKTRGAVRFMLSSHASSHKSLLYINYLQRKLKEKRKLVKTLAIIHRYVEAEYECAQAWLQDLGKQSVLTEMAYKSQKKQKYREF